MHREPKANSFVAIDAIALSRDVVKQVLSIFVVDKSKVACLANFFGAHKSALGDEERLHLLDNRGDDCILVTHNCDVGATRHL